MITVSNNICLPKTTCVNNVTSIPKQKVVISKSDSGDTLQFIREEDQQCLKDISKMEILDINLQDNSILRATRKGTLPLPSSLCKTAKTASIAPGLNNSSLLLIQKFCDDEYNVLFTKRKMYAVKDKKWF